MKSIFYLSTFLIFITHGVYAEQPTIANSSLQTSPTINCHTHIPATSVTIQPETVTPWAQMAVMQSFSFSAPEINNQLTELQNCFTDIGWKSFQEALQKSGNMQAMQYHKLNSNAQITGVVKIEPVKNNVWAVTMPLKVVYANDSRNIAQNLSVKAIIGRKLNGDLGINQLIATQIDEH